jgi:hypothetical protein
MRTAGTIAAIFVMILYSTSGQNNTTSKGSGWPGWRCGRNAQDIPYYYEEAVRGQIVPPEWRQYSIIKFSVGPGTKFDFWTDGNSFKLSAAIVTLPNVEDQLRAMQRICQLPEDPDQAAPLIHVKWESADLSGAQFSTVHGDLLRALSEYAQQAEHSYDSILESKSRIVFVDALQYHIAYDNSREHIEADVWNDPTRQDRSILDWVTEVRELAESRFHHDFPE